MTLHNSLRHSPYPSHSAKSIGSPSRKTLDQSISASMIQEPPNSSSSPPLVSSKTNSAIALDMESDANVEPQGVTSAGDSNIRSKVFYFLSIA